MAANVFALPGRVLVRRPALAQFTSVMSEALKRIVYVTASEGGDQPSVAVSVPLAVIAFVAHNFRVGDPQDAQTSRGEDPVAFGVVIGSPLMNRASQFDHLNPHP
jgi:hypothetical protein